MNIASTPEALVSYLDEHAAHVNRVFVDFDGVVIDSEPMQYRAYEVLLEEYGHELTLEEFKKNHLGKPPGSNTASMVEKFGLPIEPHDLMLRQKALATELVMAHSPENWFMRPFLDWCTRRGIAPEILSANLEGAIREVLANSNVPDIFSEIHSISGRESPITKFELIQELTDGDATKCLIIEDSESTLQAVEPLGLFAIGVYHGFNTHFDLKADVFVQSDELRARPSS